MILTYNSSRVLLLSYVALFNKLYVFAQKGVFGVDFSQPEARLLPVASIKDDMNGVTDVRCYGLTIHLISKPQAVSVYYLIDEYSTTLVQKISTYTTKPVFIADVVMVNSRLWILDQ